MDVTKKRRKAVAVVTVLICVFTTIIFLPENVYAVQKKITNPALPILINDLKKIKFKKKNVRYSTCWSKKRRVSDNLKTGKKGGKIICDVAITFSGSVTGSIGGIVTIGVGASKSTKLGYEMHVGAKSNKYMVYKGKYKVETGWRYVYIKNKKSGKYKYLGKNRYKVKRPLYGEYSLKNVR